MMNWYQQKEFVPDALSHHEQAPPKYFLPDLFPQGGAPRTAVSQRTDTGVFDKVKRTRPFGATMAHPVYLPAYVGDQMRKDLTDNGQVMDFARWYKSKTGAQHTTDIPDDVSSGLKSRDDKAAVETFTSLLDNWNEEYNTSVSNLALMIAAYVEFGLNGSTFKHIPPALLHSAKLFYAGHADALRAIVRQHYSDTQASLSKAGIKDIDVYRGMNISEDDAEFLPSEMRNLIGRSHTSGGVVQATMPTRFQPLSAVSTNPDMAHAFARPEYPEDTGAVMRLRVPRERIFSTPYTGPGLLRENEMVLLGNKDYQADVAAFPALARPERHPFEAVP